MRFRDFLLEDVQDNVYDTDEDLEKGRSEHIMKNFKEFPDKYKEGTEIAKKLEKIKDADVNYQGWEPFNKTYYFNFFIPNDKFPHTFTATSETEAIQKFEQKFEEYKKEV